SLGFQLENAPSPDLSLSSGTQLYRRDAEQDRFTSGQYVEDTGKFSGVREPTHREESYTGLVHQTDLTRRLEALGASHKLRVGVEATLADSLDENRGIRTEDRDEYLPLDVQLFDPEKPNYYRPAYSEDVYRRVITDREVRLGYTALAADTRSAFNHGRTVFTSGLRYDLSRIEVEDRRTSTTTPHSEKTSGTPTFHLGANQRAGKRVLLFANTSSAVEPSTRVDSRTGEIQENEATHGYEFGARTVLFERKLSLSAIAYRYINTDIARRNPLYNDPVADAGQTQPQLVSSGEEEFRGYSVQSGWKPVPTWTFTARAAWLEAITVSSPDIPEEEGLPLTNVPEFTAGAGVRRSFLDGRLRGLSLNGSVTHVGEVVQNYARADRIRIDYPAYTVVGAGAGFTLPRGKIVHTFSANISNLLDENLLAKIDRLNAERSLSVGWRVAF
ncbi:MAG: TonB-dependent receptor, partial [Burkholderiales bacterium]|nr:TonB-dependent receptor [Opitutaceae bacterium]